MKKKISLIALIFQAVAAVSLFLPWIFSEEYWARGNDVLSPYRLQNAYSINFFGGTATSGGILSYLTLIVMILSVVVFALICSNTISPLTKYGVFTSVIALVLFAIVTFIRCATRKSVGGTGLDMVGFWNIKIGWLFYISFALQIVAAVLAVLLALNKFSDARSN